MKCLKCDNEAEPSSLVCRDCEPKVYLTNDKQFIKIVGNVSKDVTLERIMSFIKQDAEAMTGRVQNDDTKIVSIEICVKEIGK